LQQVLANVISNQELIPGHFLIRLEDPVIATEARPGQFVTISCAQELLLRRPLSIHRVEGQKQIDVILAVVGSGTKWLSEREKGEKVDLLGPLGNGFSMYPSSNKLLLVAGGIGIAPLAFMAQEGVRNGKTVKLLLGARSKNRLYPRELLPEGITTVIATEDGSQGEKGKVTDILPGYIDWADQIFACGPIAMYQSISRQTKHWQKPKPVQISLEVTIGCGVGACFGCSIRTAKGMRRVCRDGPVFDLDEVMLEEVRI